MMSDETPNDVKTRGDHRCLLNERPSAPVEEVAWHICLYMSV